MSDTHALTTSRLANEIARLIHDGFAEFHDRFRAITRRAAERFRDRDWHGLHADARERMHVRERVVQALLVDIRSRLGPRLNSRLAWAGVKAVYSGLIEQRDDWEIAETFYNSLTRRVFATVGVDAEIEFVHTDYPASPTPARSMPFRRYEAESAAALVRQALADHPELGLTAATLVRGAAAVAARMGADPRIQRCREPIREAEFAACVFYRGEHAYLVGRARAGDATIPLVLCLAHDRRGPYVDAVLLDEDDVSLLFSYTRSYFMAEVQRPSDLVAFLKTLIPRKRVAEIYISLGYNKHGKTELYRNALRHRAESTDCYQLAAGQRGMVMVVFTMPSFPVVFKVIRDEFEYPKDCTRASVIQRYRQVFEHDRAGRLIDAQEYDFLVIDRRRFADELLDELHAKAANSVRIESDRVVIKHCYAERRVTPLNVYLQEADDAAARRAVLDYGQAITDLATTNLFPGDLLLKNFGVTRNERVVFYDYDEVCLVTDCNFRRLPQPRTLEEEVSGEPWFSVGPRDVFPEEWPPFLGLPPALRDLLVERYAELFDPDSWNALKDELAAGALFHVPPYGDDRRLAPPAVRAVAAVRMAGSTPSFSSAT